MDNKTFAEERAEEERLQKQMLQGDVLSSQDKKDPIKNPDIKIIPKVINREKEASYKIAEFELSKLKNDLLASNDSNSINTQKLAEILQRLIK